MRTICGATQIIAIEQKHTHSQISVGEVAAGSLTRRSPDYPYVARRSKLEGSGLFRLRIDLGTGKVTNITIAKSTGVDVLDHSALWALRRWEFKPGRWKELDTPVTFTMSAALPGPRSK